MILYTTSIDTQVDIKIHNMLPTTQFWRYHEINIRRYNTLADYDDDSFETVILMIDNRYKDDVLYIDIYLDNVSVMPIATFSKSGCIINKIDGILPYVYDILFALSKYMAPKMMFEL